ncbi:hypothetical protein FDP41_013558 [Naegleria fowleri]|uniref:Uncharacterized protein n=1 Tax=Naegleria fowleri TaxID=5763 RepID=A0A6A5C192_NAEFO|nr:uncharacterized protein FDP41_013558 [Naegleria fowleri]KAF0980344.1 hypothetical protein FDP41_013558 [Naegleria fowleri]CAG4715510.1 unnamed protein product [Naegleria fowleri]
MKLRITDSRTESSSFAYLLIVAFISIAYLVVVAQDLEALPISIQKSFIQQQMKNTNGGAFLPVGIKASVQQRALNYMAQQLMPLIQKQLNAPIAVPDVQGEVETPIGHVTYQLSSITLSRLGLSTPSIQVNPQGLGVTISSATAHMNCNWHYRENSWPHISDSGSADADITIAITFNVQVVIQDSTHFNIVLSGFNARFTNFNLSLHGGASWLYNIFLNNFKNSIEQAAQNAINTQVASAVNNVLSNTLSTLNLQIPILSYGVLFDSTLQIVSYTPSTYMTIGTAGRCFIKGQQPYPGQPSYMPNSLGNDVMIEMFVSDYTLNSAGFAFTQAGIFNYLLTQHTLPSAISWMFNTTNLQFFIPALYNKYPNRELQVDFIVPTAPVFTISPKGVEVSLIAQAIFQVILPTGPVNAFALNLNALLDWEVQIVANNLTGSLQYKSANVTLAYSTIGNLDVSLISSIVNLLFQYGIVPIGNILAQRGFPLPTVEGLTLQNPTVSYQTGFIAVRSNFVFVPPSSSSVSKQQ